MCIFFVNGFRDLQQGTPTLHLFSGTGLNLALIWWKQHRGNVQDACLHPEFPNLTMLDMCVCV